jgi:hypothetical protein
MKEKILYIFTAVLSLSFVGLVFYATYNFNHRLSRMEEQMRWMDENFIYLNSYGTEGTTEQYMDMKEVNRRLERLEIN